MKKQTVMWTALPNGVIGAGEAGGPRLRLSVFVSPRLQTDEGGARPTLAQFPDLLNWPARAAAATFAVRFDGGPTVPADQVVRVPVPADPDPAALWSAVFRSTTYVKPYVFPSLEDRVILSYPVRNVQEAVSLAYEAVAVESPVSRPELNPGRPELSGLTDLIRDVGMPVAERQDLAVEMGLALRGQTFKATFNAPPQTRSLKMQAPLTGGTARPMSLRMTQGAFKTNLPQVTADFQQLAMFHQVVAMPRRAAVATPAAGALTALGLEQDFHELVSALGQFPGIMRRLGLVIDLEVPYQPGMDAATAVRVVPQWTPQQATAGVTPRTRCRVRADSFVSLSREDCGLEEGESEFRDGMLRLDDDEGFEVGQMDVDAVAIKALQYADELQDWVVKATVAMATNQPVPPQPVADTTLPPQRTGGIWVARMHRARELATKTLPRALARQNTVQSLENKFAPVASVQGASAPVVLATTAAEDSSLELFTEDLVRGYRLDVWDGTTAAWHSLCKRVGSYHFLRAASAGAPAVDNLIADVHDEGWISSAGRETGEGDEKTLHLHEILFRWEGWSLVASRPDLPLESEGVPDASPGVRGLDTDFTPEPRSLPRLRFGHEYRLRARTVDLAGNGVGPETTADSAATESLVFTRHEPVGSPALVPRKDLDDYPGETVTKLVIRSTNEVKTEPDGATSAQAAAGADAQHTAGSTERHVIPPMVSQVMAETHGKFDGASGMLGDTQTYQMILAHDQVLQEFYDSDTLSMPYLADPMAAGAVLKIVYPLSADPTREHVVPVPFIGTWPDISTFRVQVVEPQGAETPAFDDATRIVTVPLPKAETALLTVSCYLDPTAADVMAMWHTTTRALARAAVARRGYTPGDRQLVRRDLPNLSRSGATATRLGMGAGDRKRLADIAATMTSGANLLMTPSRQIDIVHAVQQPLGVPHMHQMASARKFGDTYALLIGRVVVDGKSAAKIDVEAKWSEPLDDLAKATPETLQVRQHVWDLALQPTDKEVFIALPQEATLPGLGVSVGDLQKRQDLLLPGHLEDKYIQEGIPGFPGGPGPEGPGGGDPMPDIRPDARLQSTAAMGAALQAGALQNGALQGGALQGGALRGGANQNLANAGENVAGGVSTSAAALNAGRARTLRQVANPGTGQMSAVSRAQTLTAFATTSRAGDLALFADAVLGDLPPGVPRRHEFGDTRYRRVSYTSIAASRFRDCFDFTDDEITQGTRPITRVSPVAEVDILSSARPAAPKLMYVVPVFGWDRSEQGGVLTSKRSGGGLRVYVERPWYSSGEGELLGIVIPHLFGGGVDPRHSSTYPYMDTVKSLVTQMGGDPIWRSTATTAWPLLGDFKNPASTEGDLTLDELWADGTGPMKTHRDLRVAVAGYPVTYDEERRLWFADIEINPGPSYFPFVRLALARYQPKSVVRELHDCKLSRVALADFAQLLPARTTTVTPTDARHLTVKVTGQGYIGSAARGEPSIIRAIVQTRGANSSNEFAWQPVGDATVILNAQRPSGANTNWTWTGSVTLPADRGSQPFRLLVQETEWFPIDRDSEAAKPQLPTVPNVMDRPVFTERLVYADTFEL